MSHFFKQQIKLKGKIILFFSFLAIGSVVTPALLVSLANPVFTQTILEKQLEAERLFSLCQEHLGQDQFESALESCQQALNSHQEIRDRSGEAKSMTNLGIAYLKSDQFNQGIFTLEKALEIARETEEQEVEANALILLGVAYLFLGEDQKFSEFLQQALSIAQEIGDTKLAEFIQRTISPFEEKATSPQRIEADTLMQKGIQQFQISQYRQALQSWQQTLEIYRAIRDRNGEAHSLNNLGLAYDSLEKYSQAIEYYQQSLAIFQEIGDRQEKADSLLNLGTVYRNLKQYSQAIEYYQQSLAIFQEIGDRNGEANSLNNLGVVYQSLGQYSKAIDYFEQSLIIRRDIGDRKGEAGSLNNLGLAYQSLGQYSKTIEYYKQSLTILQEIGYRKGEASSLNNLGNVYQSLGQYPQSIDDFKQSLAIQQEIGDRNGEAGSLGNLGNTYRNLGQYPQAIEYHKQSLAIQQEIGDHNGEASSLGNLGNAYESLGQYQKAIDFHQQSLIIDQEIGDREGEAGSLQNLGVVHQSLGHYSKAIDYFEQSLIIQRDIGDREGEAGSLNNLGLAYQSLGQYSKTIEYYKQSLAIQQEIGDRKNEGITLSNLGDVYNQQEQFELAIVFYKQSVKVLEGIRQDIRVLERQLQESYTETVAGPYRNLADLLLSQDRIYEAQQVLELLKIQEIQDFTRSKLSRGEAEVVLLLEEQRIIDSYGKLVLFAQELNQCELTQCPKLSDLYTERDKLENELDTLILELETLIGQRNVDDKQFLTPDLFNRTANRIIEASDQYNAQPGTAVIYPLVLEDKIWILWAVKGKVIGKAKIDNVGRLKLNNEILKLSSALKDPNSDRSSLQTSANQLYEWLIAPIEQELSAKEIEINHLAFSLDRALRYIPMEVLFDGQQYLMEKYTITTFISAALTDTSDRLPNELNQTNILGLGAANAPGYDALKHVPTEINNIVQEDNSQDQQGIYPGLELLDDEFTYLNLRNNLKGRKILHIATHGDFVPGNQNASYLVLGNGEKLTIEGEQSIKTLKNYLDDVHLVVLSGCETAVGEATKRIKTQVESKDSTGAIKFEEGVEINALSYYFISGGAKTVIASLWQVDDASTSQLMQRFYCTLANENTSITKAQALRKAKLSLFKKTPLDCEQPTSENADFTHPHYWAPFILIGNGL
ncbi:MAG: tetratricopeptide repeat protein [Xenococcus sp. (in: cyanobacteria)]